MGLEQGRRSKGLGHYLRLLSCIMSILSTLGPAEPSLVLQDGPTEWASTEETPWTPAERSGEFMSTYHEGESPKDYAHRRIYISMTPLRNLMACSQNQELFAF